jgi:hypothetical protein
MSKYWLSASLLIAVSCANASPCDRLAKPLTPAQRATLSAAVAGQLQAPSAKIRRAYRLGNWHLLYVDTPGADEAFLFYRGDPLNRQYLVLWSGEGEKTRSSELRSWARLNAPGIPENLAKCFAWAADSKRQR